MVWITGLTDVYRGRIAEDWGMDALEEVFGVRLNRHPSSLRHTDIGVDKPNVCYMMPVYEYLGTSAQFQEERQRLRSKQPTGSEKQENYQVALSSI